MTSGQVRLWAVELHSNMVRESLNGIWTGSITDLQASLRQSPPSRQTVRKFLYAEGAIERIPGGSSWRVNRHWKAF